MKLSDKIIRHRKSNGWSQEEFAEKLNVSRQAISRWENETALPDAQNLLQISKLFRVTTDYLLNDELESDCGIPAVQASAGESEDPSVKRKRLHLISAICFTVAVFGSMIGLLSSTTRIRAGLSCFAMALCAGNAAAQFVLFFRKR